LLARPVSPFFCEESSYGTIEKASIFFEQHFITLVQSEKRQFGNVGYLRNICEKAMFHLEGQGDAL